MGTYIGTYDRLWILSSDL